MSFRVAHKTLARSSAQAGAAASASSPSASAPSPLLQFPAFHPVPFQQDKFLSIKTRSLETYTKLRGDVLQRCADLSAQLQRNQERALRGGNSSGSGSSPSADPILSLQNNTHLTSSTAETPTAMPELPSLPLSPHQAEELLLLSKKVESLSDFQGLVLTDELVWRMFHLCVQCGAPQQAVEMWLQKHIIAEKRGPPYPLLVVEDLATLLRSCVLPRLPESGASLACRSLLVQPPAGNADGDHHRGAAIEDGLFAAQRHLLVQQSLRRFTPAEENDAAPTMQTYARHLLNDFVWPVWRSMEAMQLTCASLTKASSADGEAAEESGVFGDEEAAAGESDNAAHDGAPRWPPDVVEQTTAIQTMLMSVSPLYSFHASSVSSADERHATTAAASSGKSDEQHSGKGLSSRARLVLSHDPPNFTSEVDAVVAPLRALLDLWLVVAQCASEAKDTRLLWAVQRTVCAAFLTSAAAAAAEGEYGGAEGPVYTLNEAAWCRYGPTCDGRTELSKEAEAKATGLVRAFVGNAFSVLQYGLLCAEQEAVLWQLHDSCAFVFGGAALLQRWRNPSKSSAASPSAYSSCERRLQALTAVTQRQSAEERAEDLLRNVLPLTLCATAHGNGEGAAGSSDAAMVESVRALFSRALASTAAATRGGEQQSDESAVAAFADASLYVGLATCDDALLERAATAAAMPETETSLVRWNARVLQEYRSAVASLVDVHATRDGEAVESAEAQEDVMARLQELIASVGQDSGGAASAAAVWEGALQLLILHTARQQAESAAAYVRVVYAGQSSDAGGVHDGETEVGSGEGADVQDNAADGEGHHGMTEEALQVAAEEAWARLHAQTTQYVTAALEQVVLLLESRSSTAEGSGLSPSALSSLAVLARIGVYLEQAQCSSAASNEVEAAAAATTSLRSSLDKLLARLTVDSCTVLRQASLSRPSTSAQDNSAAAAAGPTTAVSGTWVQWVLVTLMSRRDWPAVLEVLSALDGPADASSSCPSLLCSATVDPAVFAALYTRAQEDGAAGVCAFLRPRREALFF